MSHFFAYINRMRFINRWALMRNSYTENIQEHSHQVAVLAHALAVIRNRCFGGCVDEGTVAVAALYHDAPEILTGDLPTPVKYYNPEIRDAYKQVEAFSAQKLLGMLPEHLRQQRASGVALAAWEKIGRGESGNAAALVPNYLRLSQAERARLEKTKTE